MRRFSVFEVSRDCRDVIEPVRRRLYLLVAFGKISRRLNFIFLVMRETKLSDAPRSRFTKLWSIERFTPVASSSSE